jgi:large subunit ribosomal protein L4
VTVATLPVYTAAGEKAGDRDVPDALFGDSPRPELLHQVVVAELAAQRQGTAHTKTRGEVAGSGRKLWRQKGTGRARVGDRRPPNRVGGGRAMGPRARSYRQRTTPRVKRQALRAALAARATSGDLVLLEAFELTEAKTRALNAVLESVVGVKGVLLLLGEPSEIIARCGRNIPDLRVTDASNVSAYDVLAARKVIVTTDALPRLEARLS